MINYRLKINREFTRAKVFVLNDLALKHALMNLYSAFITRRNWGLLVHSSCIEQDGKAYLFAGRSGAGKSTVVALSAPRPLWSDEATILKVERNQTVKVFPSPFYSDRKVSLENPGQFCELSGIYLLTQSSQVKTRFIRQPDALLGLMGKVFNWPIQPEETGKVFAMCKHLVGTGSGL